ncbi:MAG: hypothetical protein ABI743_00665 [bacterium]
MSAQRAVIDPSLGYHLPGGYRSATPSPAAQAVVYQAVTPRTALFPRSRSWAWPLAGLTVSLLLAGGLQLQVLSGEQEIRGIDRAIAEAEIAIQQEQHIVHVAAGTRLAAAVTQPVGKSTDKHALLVPSIDGAETLALN